MRRFVQRFTSCLLVLSMILSFGVAAQADGVASQPLSDINQSYAKSEIEALVSAGVLSGYEDGSFQPAKLVTRAELAKILVIALGLKVKEDGISSTSFKDVAPSSWYAQYVDALVKSGITQGTSQDAFSPNANVRREELVVFLTRALGLDKLTLSTVSKEDFADLKEVSDWAKNAVILASEIDLVNGEEGPNGEPLFAPKRFADRQAIARLAYEVKEHRDAYISKSKELANAVQALKITKIEAVSNTSVEVTFDKDLLTLDKADFAFDKTLKVEAAAFKSGSKAVVVLTTSSQSLGTEYHLTFRGQVIEQAMTGAGAGGGGGGMAPGTAAPTVAEQLASGKTIATLTVTASGSYGPASGQTSVGTLILDPGQSGEVTLTNIHADNLQVKSGAVSSIKLSRSTITMLVVNAVNNNGQPVRILALDGAVVSNTSVESQAILESATTTGTLGAITIQPGAAGKTISLRGNIDGSVTNNAGNAQLQIEAPSNGNAQPTIIHTIHFGSGTPILTVASSVQIQQIVSATPVTIKGDPDAVAKLLDIYPAAVVDVAVREAARLAAVAAIDEAFRQTQVDIPDRLKLFEKADLAIDNATSLGVSELAFNISSYREMKSAVQEIFIQLNALQIQYQPGDSADSVTQYPIFPSLNDGNGAILIQSDKSEVLSTWGPLQRPAYGAGDAVVHITLTLQKGAFSASKVVALTVKQFDATIQLAQSVRSDLVLVYFNHPVVNSQISDFQISGLQVKGITQYSYLAEYALLSVDKQTDGKDYSISFQGKEAISFKGGESNRCSATTCPTSITPFPEIPLPNSQVPGGIHGFVNEWSETGSPAGLKDATVSIVGTNLTAKTDSQGYFKIDQVPSGVTYTVQITKADYSTIVSGQFSLQSGEPYFAGIWYLHKKPRPVAVLNAQVINSGKVSINWYTNEVSSKDNNIYFQVIHNGTELPSTGTTIMQFENLKPGSDNTFSVQACNDMGCSDPVEISVQLPLQLKISDVRPVDTVTGTVYEQLIRQGEASTYVLPTSASSADVIRFSLSDLDYVSDSGAPMLKGVLDGSKAKASVIGQQADLPVELIVDNGVTYLKVKLVPPPFTDMHVTGYTFYGMKYTFEGKEYTVDYMGLNIVPQ
ncbi:S-layer homology domain-containing protein [Paenibacillus whitsoniae]|uniref:S-layer homology domain-containing protein n=1 Tax=Paenibacillus whitsoniae TaxID=2496558 RepID=A0A3S0BH15_9BACL|nr:S-layer homology domain-containing protein [Paenibacillus whitsoniae]RTE03038.1 hypothetical protein EJQ19_28360 [Paenibacillus whitsoniae]